MVGNSGPRPAMAVIIGVVGLTWAVCTLAGEILGIALCALIGAGSWLGGPILGFVGTALSLVVIGYLVVTSLLSFLLLWAGWLTLSGDPRGVTLLRTWAWISLILDVIALAATTGFAANGWFGLFYAVAVLYFTTPSQMNVHWDRGSRERRDRAKPKFNADPDF